jgi:hypothetical protein
VPTEGLPERRNRPLLVLGAAAATALVITVLNNLGTGAGTPAFPFPEHTELPSPTRTTLTRVAVPTVVGQQEQSATRLLTGRHLATEAIHRFVACHPAGMVTEQDPQPGIRVAAGETVVLVVVDAASEVLSCPEGVASDADRAVADGLYDFSIGVSAGPPAVTSPVRLGLFGDEPMVTLTGGEAADPGLWRTRPFGGTGDPVPLLDVLAETGGEYRVDGGPHRPCAGPAHAPARAFASLRQVSITPTTPDSCRDGWALDLFLDGTGRIQGVNLDPGGGVTSP